MAWLEVFKENRGITWNHYKGKVKVCRCTTVPDCSPHLCSIWPLEPVVGRDLITLLLGPM